MRVYPLEDGDEVGEYVEVPGEAFDLVPVDTLSLGVMVGVDQQGGGVFVGFFFHALVEPVHSGFDVGVPGVSDFMCEDASAGYVVESCAEDDSPLRGDP